MATYIVERPTQEEINNALERSRVVFKKQQEVLEMNGDLLNSIGLGVFKYGSKPILGFNKKNIK